MTTDNVNFWLEVGKLAVSVATPIVVAIIGVLLLRRIEGVKSLVAKQSEFHKKWAEEFFGCCQGFMQALELQGTRRKRRAPERQRWAAQGQILRQRPSYPR